MFTYSGEPITGIPRGTDAAGKRSDIVFGKSNRCLSF
jgi:hypothetical protein